jgi:hypothetical protein
MKPDDYLKMLEDRITDYSYNMATAYRNYLSERSKLEAAIKAKEMYEKLVEEGLA